MVNLYKRTSGLRTISLKFSQLSTQNTRTILFKKNGPGSLECMHVVKAGAGRYILDLIPEQFGF
jgi:hypothetical protein